MLKYNVSYMLRGVGTFRDETHHEKHQRGGWVILVNFEKYFGSVRRKFREKMDQKCKKRERFFPSFCQILEEKIDFLLKKFKYFSKDFNFWTTF